MFQYSSKTYIFFVLLISCGSLINGFSKRENLGDENVPMLDPVKVGKELSTMQSILKGMNEKVEEELEKVENEALEEVESKDNEATEASASGNKEPSEEPETKETEREEQAEDAEKTSSTDETSKSIDMSSTLKTVPSENDEIPSSASPISVTDLSIEKEKGPEDTFVVWNAKGKVCLIARFHVVFSITYPGKGGEQKAEVTVPKDGTAKGNCETTSISPLLRISWQNYVFTMIFNQTEEDSWIVTSMELTYDTADTLFDGATNAGKKIARSKPLTLFETPMKKSFYCPAQEVIFMYSANKQVVTARMKDIYLQPYGIEDGKFSPPQRCSKVVIDGIDEAPYVQDETVPLAVGCTLALITLLILLGFSFHRAYNAAKVDCNTME